jgi:hypothetical protein
MSAVEASSFLSSPIRPVANQHKVDHVVINTNIRATEPLKSRRGKPYQLEEDVGEGRAGPGSRRLLSAAQV